MSTDEVKVRALQAGDQAAWRPLWDGYNAFYGRAGPTALAIELTELTWSRFFDTNEPMHALVAEHASGLIGLVHYLFHRSTTLVDPICYLQDLYAAPAARRQGVGRALIEAVYARARAAGSARVYWHTHETNHTAMRLYNQLAGRSGFIVYRHTL